ncbi:MAG: TlyA family RNA methyltransferase [Holophagales bacterium]|jgi:23S rRNA (cytidine1920-2'-O)/16S rRNA (cytidine1409-2'-O)-methyltransferase|nr:TlyA family RNA methyltransferase [Holophagales bacterium]
MSESFVLWSKIRSTRQAAIYFFMAKIRLDLLILQRGLCETRAKAQARILAGEVLVEGHPITKAGTTVQEDADVRLRGDPLPYVSRGGLKLEGAIRAFGVDPIGLVCFDAGASTGGFTDCLLQHGAERVYAVDAGTNQLHWKLRSDPRVVSIEQCNLRNWNSDSITEKCALLTADVSFISLRLVVPPILPSLQSNAEAIVLVKPQFEAGRAEIEKGGLVKDPLVHERVCRDIWDFFSTTQLKPQQLAPSPISGSHGNVEFLMYLRLGGKTRPFSAENIKGL